uniref:Ig-like domain-containing protein n=1 Tax=Varanus komodoensis TaxID=61221 RepID=A0A8D2JHX1_VARKO
MISVSGLLGDSVQLRATIPPNFYVREAFWKVVIPVHEMVASSFKGTSSTLYQSRFYGRCRLYSNFTLEVGPLGLEDAGTFLVLLVNATGEMKEQVFHLAVHAASVPAIQVFAEERGPNVSAGSCMLFLTCSVSGGSNISYSWTRPGGKDPARKEHVLFQNGQVLWLTVDVQEEKQELYTCTAANAVSKESATVDPLTGAVLSFAANKGFPYDYRDALLIIVPFTSLFIAGMCVFLCSRRSSGKYLCPPV